MTHGRLRQAQATPSEFTESNKGSQKLADASPAQHSPYLHVPLLHWARTGPELHMGDTRQEQFAACNCRCPDDQFTYRDACDRIDVLRWQMLQTMQGSRVKQTMPTATHKHTKRIIAHNGPGHPCIHKTKYACTANLSPCNWPPQLKKAVDLGPELCVPSIHPGRKQQDSRLHTSPGCVLDKVAHNCRDMPCCPLGDLLCAGSSNDCGGQVLVHKCLQLVGNLVVV